MRSTDKTIMAAPIDHPSQFEVVKEPSSPGLKGATLSTLSPSETKKLLRKIDRRVIPILAILYFFSFLDRGNWITCPFLSQFECS